MSTRGRRVPAKSLAWIAPLQTSERIVLGSAVVLVALAGLVTALQPGAVIVFCISAVALALLAATVGDATEQLGVRLGPGATGVLQSALGNLPELFVGIFALRQGLVTVVQATIVGSILGNCLLVLGVAFLVGGLRNGTQRFATDPPRIIATLTLLAVAAIAVPTLASGLHTPAGRHTDTLSIGCAIVLLALFALSIPSSLGGGSSAGPPEDPDIVASSWPLWLAVVILSAAGVGALFVSDWFVSAIVPAIAALHISQAFTGLVIVAIAGNAVENFVGVQMAARNKPDFAISVILNSSLQVALGLTPVLVLLSFAMSSSHLTLVLPPMLVAALGMAAVINTVIVFDGESNWLEGAALIGLYIMIATSFWWG